MKSFPLTTQSVVISSSVGLLLWEFWTFCDKVPENTISEVVWGFINHGFLLRFAAGFLFAHWFFQRKQEAAEDDPVFRFLKKFPVWATYAGLICGYLFWQRAPRLAHSTTKPEAAN